jgi:hypothetical protein
MLNTNLFAHGMAGGPGTPGLRAREASGTERNMALGRSVSGRSRSHKRGSVVIEEENEEEEEEEVEEVEAFSPVEVGRGESVHSITVWDERRQSNASDGIGGSQWAKSERQGAD